MVVAILLILQKPSHQALSGTKSTQGWGESRFAVLHNDGDQSDSTDGKHARREVVGFNFGKERKPAFQRAKDAVVNNLACGRAPEEQYRLSADAFRMGAGAYFSQLKNGTAGEFAAAGDANDEIPVIFMSLVFTMAQSRHHTAERETLAILLSLDEACWLIQCSKFPTMLDTDQSALKTTGISKCYGL